MDERTHARYMSDIAYFLSKMEAEPNSGYFIPIALAYNKLEKYDETIAMCKSAIERFPANCAAKTFLAEAYVYKGQFDLARDYLFDVTAEDDNNYKALKLLGIICKESGETAEAIKYLTGAYIRSPEDAEVKAMLEELGGSLNPGEIYDERIKRQSQAAYESEEDEELKTFKEIDQRIRNAEIIMADLVSDKTITSGKNSGNKNKEKEEQSEKAEEVTSDATVNSQEEELNIADENNHIESEQQSSLSDNQEEDLLSTLSDDNNEESKEDDLLSALNEDSNEESKEDDLLSALSEDSNEESKEDDLLSALNEDSNEESKEDDLLSALSEDSNEENKEDLNTETISDNMETMSEDSESISDDAENISTDTEAVSEDTYTLSADTETALEDIESTLKDTEDISENLENISDNADVVSSDTEDILDDTLNTAENRENTEENIESRLSDREDISENLENISDNADTMLSDTEDILDDTLNTAEDRESTTDQKHISDNSCEQEELYSRKVPNSVADMTYDDMIGDDFQYGSIVDESYEEGDMPQIDLGESAPFTQGDIMDEILDAVGMTSEDMADDEEIELSSRERRLMRLEQFLDKVKQNKEMK